MTPEVFTQQIQKVLPKGLSSVILYGSAVAGDYFDKRSDYNILIIADQLGTPELKALSKPVLSWLKAGNPFSVLWTFERLQKSVDAFPIELLDIQQMHKVLYGEDIIAQLQVSRANLRLQVEHELKGKLLAIRENYCLTQGKSDRDYRVVSPLPLYFSSIATGDPTLLPGLYSHHQTRCDRGPRTAYRL